MNFFSNLFTFILRPQSEPKGKTFSSLSCVKNRKIHSVFYLEMFINMFHIFTNKSKTLKTWKYCTLSFSSLNLIHLNFSRIHDNNLIIQFLESAASYWSFLAECDKKVRSMSLISPIARGARYLPVGGVGLHYTPKWTSLK